MGRVKNSKAAIAKRLEEARNDQRIILVQMQFINEGDYTLHVALAITEKRIDDLLIEMHKED